MIRIDYYGGNETIGAAVVYVNNLFNYIPFLDAIYNTKQFDMATVSPREITDMFCNTDLRLSIDLYWPLKFCSEAYTYDDRLNPTVIHLNKLKLNRPVHSVCNTLLHQCVHALNAQYPAQYFGHGNNEPKGKERTAPYCIAGIGQKIVAEDDRRYDYMPHEDVANIPSKQPGGSSIHVPENLFRDGIFCIYDMMAIMEAN